MKDKILRGINRMKDSDQLDVYIDTLEKTLERCDIPEDNYLYFLQINISGKYLQLLEESDLDTRHSSIAC